MSTIGIDPGADCGDGGSASTAASGTGVQFVRFTMFEPQVFAIDGSCPGAFSGCDFLDMSELEVFGVG